MPSVAPFEAVSLVSAVPSGAGICNLAACTGRRSLDVFARDRSAQRRM